MAGGNGSLIRSSAGHWKPLFNFGSPRDRGALDKPKPGDCAASPHPSDGVAITTSQPLIQTKDEWQLADGAPGRRRAQTEPVKGILLTKEQREARKAKRVSVKLNWLHGLVDQEIEARPLDPDDERTDWSPSRSSKRKATGAGGMAGADGSATESETAALKSEVAAPKQLSEADALKQKKSGADADDASDAFSDTDNEFEEVEDQAEKNMRINSAATKISEVEIEAASLNLLPLAPLTPSSGQQARGEQGDGSSFASSSHAGDPVAPKQDAEGGGPSAAGFVTMPVGSGCAAVKQLRKQDSKSESSFGDSDDDK